MKNKEHLSFLHTLFTCRQQRRRQKQKKKGKTLTLSSVSTFLPSKSQISRHDLLNQTEEYLNHPRNNIEKRIVNTSIISGEKTSAWKQNDGGFQRGRLTNDNTDGNNDGERVTRSSSSSTSTSVAAAADRLIQRQRRKQTMLKRKAGSEKREEKKQTKKKTERNKKSLTSSIEAEATEASLCQFITLNTPTIDTNAMFYPYAQAKYAEKNTTKKENYIPIQTSGEHQHQQQQKQQFKSDLTNMADGHTNRKKNENIRVFVHHRRRRRQGTSKRVFRRSSSSTHSHETISSSSSSSSSTNMEDFLSLIQQQINSNEKKSPKNKNVIIVNYKPVFVNSPRTKPSLPNKNPPILVTKPKIFPTDDDFSSATHYSRRRSLTTTSSDGSPLRSPVNRSCQEQSLSLDVPDVEDPLVFIEMMYQQLFTEDGQLRSGTEPAMLANCVKQIVTNSRRNSVSSSITNGSTSVHLKQKNLNPTSLIHQQQRTSSATSYHPVTPSKSVPTSSSSSLIPVEHSDTFSDEEEEEEPDTIIQVIKNNVLKIPKRSNLDNHSQNRSLLNSSQPKRFSTRRTTTTIRNNGFHLSVDDTDNEDLDTFSDLNSIRFNNKTIQTSPSIEDDFTHTDSRLLSSSGYHSFDRSQKSSLSKPLRSKSHSENDLSHLSLKNDTQSTCIHHCPNCIRPLTVTVIPPLISSPSLLQRIQQPIGLMLMKYLNFILLSKNVLLLPLFIFLLRQRSIHLGN